MAFAEKLLQILSPSRGLPADAVDVYQARRPSMCRDHLCRAPFNNMYFTVTGHVGPCWLTLYKTLNMQWSPTRSVRDIWFGPEFEKIRKSIRDNNLHAYCRVCEHNIAGKRNPLATTYDTLYPLTDYPRTMELELSNTCGLECVMCSGLLSSTIRAKREKKPPIESPYNDQFVDEMEEFIPHLQEVRFSGGEPFRHKIVYKLLERIEKLNPSLRVMVTTSGALFGPAIATWFSRLNFNVGCSVDSLVKDRYEKIRVNAKYDTVIRNVESFVELTRRHGRVMTMQMNPMRMNWDEPPEFVRFCNQRRIWLNFNTVQEPKDLAIWTLPREDLERIYDQLSSERIETEPGNQNHADNLRMYNDLLTQIRGWRDDPVREVLKA